jgi:mono/diheme cytochrome c family protein
MQRISWSWVVLGFLVLFLITSSGLVLAQETPAATEKNAEATPTIDRLAAPPTVIPATQADDGAQLFWLWCQPCHGDKGQGLTDEWREQYPVEDQNCWNPGCHGNLPYEDGFKLPKHVPALIGGQSMARFQTMEEVFDYVHTRMPFEYPGALSEEEALAVTAYLARAHEKWDGTPLTTENVSQIRWQALPTSTPSFSEAENLNEGNEGEQIFLLSRTAVVVVFGFLIFLMLLGGFYVWQRRH